MNRDQMERLFRPFTTVSEEHHRLYGGTGIGLWISKVIVELMGGKITCKSTPAEGTSFTF
jgi:signal transduction histidine kinase